ncbi:hypothetical protein O6H91_10G033500 [Diphasiastrum complanatum]|uniref:Uncharacterized protein n=1 Tax=Diphasiastrum complanatum TaxID=34168 RepID=A0ACC2CFS9_DIPCM|nr:hypothetical protein O6H91_10G033500 [Diphasiastrum complanatum]
MLGYWTLRQFFVSTDSTNSLLSRVCTSCVSFGCRTPYIWRQLRDGECVVLEVPHPARFSDRRSSPRFSASLSWLRSFHSRNCLQIYALLSRRRARTIYCDYVQ